jgi:hypothetical protein
VQGEGLDERGSDRRFQRCKPTHNREKSGEEVTQLVRVAGARRIEAPTDISGGANQPTTEKNQANEVT